MNKKTDKMKYKCPRCKSEHILEFDEFIKCSECDLDFDKEFLGVIDDENVLARQELKGIVDAFDEEEKKKLLKNKL